MQMVSKIQPKILGGKVNFPLCLAPMVGLSHVALRQVVREYMPPHAKVIWPTEMLNSRKLPMENLSVLPESRRADHETEMVPQILGNEEKYIAPSVQKLIDWGAEGIDINMGCPVEKALKHNYGVALMGDRDYAARVVEMTVRNSSVPVSVKLRAGDQGDPEFLVKFVRGLIEAGAQSITLHPRTAAQKRRGSADWEQIKYLKNSVSVPVIGNGDIQTSEDVSAMLRDTGCDMVMAGRALAARPWLMWQVAEDMGWEGLGERRAPRTPAEEAQEYGRSLRRLLRLLLEQYREDLALRKFRFHVRTTSVWLDFGHRLYGDMTKEKTVPEVFAALDLFFTQDLQFTARTELRQ